MKKIKYPDIKIVLVDDSEVCLNIMKINLIPAGLFHSHNMHFFQNPVEAFKFLRDNRVEILITDYVMPGINGDVLAKKIREYYPDIKIAFFSSTRVVNFDQVRKSIESVVDFIEEKCPDRKPFLKIVEALCKKVK